MKKLLIIFLVFLIGFLLLGLFSPYNYFSAKIKTYKGIHEQIHFNNEAWLLERKNKISHKFNMKITNFKMDENLVPIFYPYVKIYNKVMIKNFKEEKGDSVFNLYLNEMDSVLESTSYSR